MDHHPNRTRAARRFDSDPHAHRDKERARKDREYRRGYTDGGKGVFSEPADPDATDSYTDCHADGHCDAVRPRA